jgi:hypothetical protein
MVEFTLIENLVLLEFVLGELSQDDCLVEARQSVKTPYQKAQAARRQTIAAHTPRPAKQSTFYKHAVRAIFQKLRKNGESFKGSAKGGQLIAQYMLKKHGYASGQDSGQFQLTGKGHSRNRKHTKEPSSIRKRKEMAYDYIMGIQRRAEKRKQQVKQKALGAG